MKEYTLIVIFMIVLVICFSILFGSLVFIYNRHKKELEKLMKYQINVEATIDNKIPEILHLFVTDVFNDYRVKILEPRNLMYIKEEEEKAITKEIASLCSARLSAAMVDKLSLFWNPQSIGGVIADKIYLIVVAYVAEHNATITGYEAVHESDSN